MMKKLAIVSLLVLNVAQARYIVEEATFSGKVDPRLEHIKKLYDQGVINESEYMMFFEGYIQSLRMK